MKVKVELKYCYGISALVREFDFSKKRVFSVYASNGTMKTSFAKVFLDLSKGLESQDVIYPERQTVRNIEKNGESLRPEEVLVVKSYEEDYRSDKIARLLLNPQLKEEYERADEKIKHKKEEFLLAIKGLSGHKELSDVEKEISKVFYQSEEDKFLESLMRIKDEVKNEEYLNISYIAIFNLKTKDLLAKDSFRKNIEKYFDKYNELLEQSQFFRKGIFNHTQASDIVKQLDKNGFFKAEHDVRLKNREGQWTEVKTKEKLEALIEEEKNSILENEELRKLFEGIGKDLERNIGLRDFRDYLSNNPQVIPELLNLESFKGKLWKGYFKENESIFYELLKIHQEVKGVIDEIKKKAQEDEGQWDSVIRDFNNRFHVPFELEIENKVDVKLSGDNPLIACTFDNKKVGEEKLKSEVLSQGEKRALYILNVLFEIEGRKKENETCLLIVDDIADSFDYKNKYAIIEYLHETAQQDNFYLIILTHNFDFHRSISSRLDMNRENKLWVAKSKEVVNLKEETYQNDPLSHWINNLDKEINLLATIPMARNLLGYSGKEEEHKEISKFLHIKNDTERLTIRCLKKLYCLIFDSQKVEKIENMDSKYNELLMRTCDEEWGGDHELRLEGKIIFSMAIRLKAEKYMIKKIDDTNFVDTITKNQTFELFNKFNEKFPIDIASKKILERVNLMTPENIHLNSFMYEPIIDIGDHELKDLYDKLKELEQQS